MVRPIHWIATVTFCEKRRLPDFADQRGNGRYDDLSRSACAENQQINVQSTMPFYKKYMLPRSCGLQRWLSRILGWIQTLVESSSPTRQGDSSTTNRSVSRKDMLNSMLQHSRKQSVNIQVVAGEVATLTFLRSKGVPVPEVYGWSATTDNAIGAEYIVMEFAPGIGLDTKWFDLTKREQRTVAIEIVEVERKLFGIPFGSFGSLYFKKDIPPELQADLYAPGVEDPSGDSDTFCIGPIADDMFWYGKRAEMQVDRGPWRNPHKYLAAIGKRELEWTKRFGKPLEKDFPYNSLLPGVIPPSAYSTLLEKYLAIAPFLLPNDAESHGSAPTLRHPDLTPSNVFISPETSKIRRIIDWQHTVIVPRLLASGHPHLFENPDVELPPTLDAPQPPDGYESLDPETKAQVDELLRRRNLYYFYRVFNGAKNQLHLAACADPLLEPRKHLVDFAGRQGNGNLMTLRGALI
ncbi:phosphotransferase enzyme family protein [Blastomyces dermatitidis ATCC 18188]|uniref:Phosphotransferase enzyme family protein n=2 Tax=Ajellomyces dermatitidis TaxID=5039 RepID=F2T713_AJEDA|nr:phosphotransferase enzyme family protein [Blastomyces dermatitidis ATCC 18188]